MTHAANVASTIFLSIVVIACVLHLWANFDKHSPEVERWGFTLIAAGAFGSAVYPWTPAIEQFPIDLVMHMGMALIALGLVRGRIRGWLIHVVGWQKFDRRAPQNDYETTVFK